MISVQLNNQLISIQENSTLLALLEKHTFLEDYCAVAVNAHFIPRSQYATTILHAHDGIDVVVPMQGG